MNLNNLLKTYSSGKFNLSGQTLKNESKLNVFVLSKAQKPFRISFRSLARQGKLFGIKKSSW